MLVHQTIRDRYSQTDAIKIIEGSYEVRTLQYAPELILAYQLRHVVFADQLRWIPQTDDRLETDSYDSFATHFGAFDPLGNLIAYVRLIAADRQFMMEKEFRSIVDRDYPIRKDQDTCELTRFCVASSARNEAASGPDFKNVTTVLFKGVYQLCVHCGIRFAYGITDGTIHRYLTMKGYPYKMIGTPRKMADGVIARAVVLDWREFETVNSIKRPKFLEWYSQNSISIFPSAMATA